VKAKSDCIVCLLKQTLNTARIATQDPRIHRKALDRVAKIIPGLSLDQTPAALSQPVYSIVAGLTGLPDPFKKQKDDTNRIALALLPEARTMVARAKDKLDAAVHAAAAGNIIDLGIGHKFDIEKDFREIMTQAFAINALEDFRKELRAGRKLLYLGDNAGEIVFDTILVEQILATGTEVVFAVKSGPIINDATMADAEVSGMKKLTRIIETGSNDIGIHWDHVSDEFRAAFKNADVILAKGHGNFETCNDRPGNIYMLLKAKCDMVANELGSSLETSC